MDQRIVKSMEKKLYSLAQEGILSWIDVHFSKLMVKLAVKNHQEVALASALASYYTRQGHICVDLSKASGKELSLEGLKLNDIQCPDLLEWRKKLFDSSMVGRGGDDLPLILDNESRLYLCKYWQYQKRIFDLINEKIANDYEQINVLKLKKGLERLFNLNEYNGLDWQILAAVLAIKKKFFIITGGPGTGKTTLLAKIVALLLDQNNSIHTPPKLMLTAPTGKGALRMQEAIEKAKEKLNFSHEIKKIFPKHAITLHRLLGSMEGSTDFRYNEKNKLPVETLIIDEASMVDIALLAKLLQALHSDARLIMLGDKNQIASVEAGAAFGDICSVKNTKYFSEEISGYIENIIGKGKINKIMENNIKLGDAIITLEKNYRFDENSGIGLLSQSISNGIPEKSFELLNSINYSDVLMVNIKSPKEMLKLLEKPTLDIYHKISEISDPNHAIEIFSQFRILCALRKGPFGVVALNNIVEQLLRNNNIIQENRRWYKGMPIMVLRNDYKLQLFNGDVGMVFPDPEFNNDFRVFFPSINGALRSFHPIRLPTFESVHAMTVHKSQGSEFDNVILILPDIFSPVLTRELLYTAITRAKRKVEVWGNEKIFTRAVEKVTDRNSGLRDLFLKNIN